MKMTTRAIDIFLVLPLLAGLLMITEIDAPATQAVSLSWWAKGAILGGLTLVVGVVVAAGSAIDRRCSEEYVFQMLANAALVAFATTMLVNLGWVVGEQVVGLPELASDNILGVLTIAWALSYYWFRVKGIAQ